MWSWRRRREHRPGRGAPKDTDTFDNRAPPVSQVVHNLVSKRSSDYALRVAPGTIGMKRVLGWPGDNAIGATLVGQYDRSEGWRRRGCAWKAGTLGPRQLLETGRAVSRLEHAEMVLLTEQWTHLRNRQFLIRPGNTMTRTLDFLPLLG